MEIWGGTVSKWPQSNRAGELLRVPEGVRWCTKAWWSDSANLGRRWQWMGWGLGHGTRMPARAPVCCLSHQSGAPQSCQPWGTAGGSWDSKSFAIRDLGRNQTSPSLGGGKLSYILLLPFSKQLNSYYSQIRQALFVEREWFQMLQVTGLQTALWSRPRPCDFWRLRRTRNYPTSTTSAHF